MVKNCNVLGKPRTLKTPKIWTDTPITTLIWIWSLYPLYYIKVKFTLAVEISVLRPRHFGVVCHCLLCSLHFAWSKETSNQFIKISLESTGRLIFLPSSRIKHVAIPWKLDTLPRDHVAYDTTHISLKLIQLQDGKVSHVVISVWFEI